jgi:hypothetical protein
MDTATFQERLREYADQFRSWSEPIKQFRQSWQRKPITGLTDVDKYAQEMEDITKQQRAKYDLPAIVSSFLDQYYEVYLQSSLNDCSRIRAISGNSIEFKEFLLFSYVRRTVSELQVTGNEAWLWRGLVAMSLEDCSDDYRDTLTALAELFVTAEQHGHTPKHAFQQVARLSSHQKPSGGRTPVSEMMMNFENYAIVQERRQRGKSYWEKERQF